VFPVGDSFPLPVVTTYTLPSGFGWCLFFVSPPPLRVYPFAPASLVVFSPRFPGDVPFFRAFSVAALGVRGSLVDSCPYPLHFALLPVAGGSKGDRGTPLLSSSFLLGTKQRPRDLYVFAPLKGGHGPLTTIKFFFLSPPADAFGKCLRPAHDGAESLLLPVLPPFF